MSARELATVEGRRDVAPSVDGRPNPHAFCDRKIAELKFENGGLRIENRNLKLELERSRSSAATADGIAQAVFRAIREAMVPRLGAGMRPDGDAVS